MVEVLVIAPAVPETPAGVNVIRFGVLKLLQEYFRLAVQVGSGLFKNTRRKSWTRVASDDFNGFLAAGGEHNNCFDGAGLLQD